MYTYMLITKYTILIRDGDHTVEHHISIRIS